MIYIQRLHTQPKSKIMIEEHVNVTYLKMMCHLQVFKVTVEQKGTCGLAKEGVYAATSYKAGVEDTGQHRYITRSVRSVRARGFERMGRFPY